MHDPLPRSAKVFLAVVALAALVLIVREVNDDGLGGAVPTPWRIADGVVLDPARREIPIVVSEVACASGRSAEGRIVVDVTYGPDSVTIDVGVRGLTGDVECPSNPDTPYTVELDEPLGERNIEGDRLVSP